MESIIQCPHCYEDIIEGEKVKMTSDGESVFHFECFIRMVVGSVSHQMQTCSCYGGDQEDPPEWTRREAAKAASDFYHKSKYEIQAYQSAKLSFGIPEPSAN